jgi:FMN-dependent NADH-azoreductase
VDTLNVWHERLPEFDYEAIGAKYKAMTHEAMTEAESKVWELIQSLTQRFQNADRIVLGTPVWNFGLPYKLKQLIDLVAQRNYLFTCDGIQYGPLLNVEKAEAYVKQAMIGFNGSGWPDFTWKMGTSLPYLVGPASRLTRLITDVSDANVLNPYRSQGIEVTST